jgi:hypothetical protein
VRVAPLRFVSTLDAKVRARLGERLAAGYDRHAAHVELKMLRIKDAS